MFCWVNVVGFSVSMGDFFWEYLYVFEVFIYLVKRNVCCRVISKMFGLIEKEEVVIKKCELKNVNWLKKFLMMLKNGIFYLYVLWLVS